MDSECTRRDLIVGAAALTAAGLSTSSAQASAESIKLPPPGTGGGLPLMQALVETPFDPCLRGTRALGSDDVRLAVGRFRHQPTGKRRSHSSVVAPFDRNRHLRLHRDAVYLYEPKAHELRRVLDIDIRGKTSSMVFAATAPVVLVYAADLGRIAKAATRGSGAECARRFRHRRSERLPLLRVCWPRHGHSRHGGSCRTAEPHGASRQPDRDLRAAGRLSEVGRTWTVSPSNSACRGDVMRAATQFEAIQASLSRTWFAAGRLSCRGASWKGTAR